MSYSTRLKSAEIPWGSVASSVSTGLELFDVCNIFKDIRRPIPYIQITFRARFEGSQRTQKAGKKDKSRAM